MCVQTNIEARKKEEGNGISIYSVMLLFVAQSTPWRRGGSVVGGGGSDHPLHQIISAVEGLLSLSIAVSFHSRLRAHISSISSPTPPPAPPSW